MLLRRLQAYQVYNNKLSRFQVRQIVEEQPRNLHKAKKRVLRYKTVLIMLVRGLLFFSVENITTAKEEA